MSRIAVRDEVDPRKLDRIRARRSYNTWRKSINGRLKIAKLFAENKGKCNICHRNMILRFDGVCCENMATLDHIKPLYVSGKFDMNDNFQVVCQRCNVRKANHYKDPVDEAVEIFTGAILEQKGI